jgi:hypothetical protein
MLELCCSLVGGRIGARVGGEGRQRGDIGRVRR